MVSACGDKDKTASDREAGDNTAEPKTTAPEKEERQEMSVQELTAEDVIAAFKEEGLEVGDVTDLEKKEFGDTREEGKRILVPSLGEDAGGRLFRFKDKDGLDKAKEYYVTLGESGPMFYSHTYEKGLFLLQMNGDMEDAEFERYEKVMDSVSE
ncbi:stress protein [Sporosarcina sp. NCCP-2716]|uniref:stress protein n=1 Tax=Sporosarcina sp. NCCP-2716 TaxID=2943679 RepID=UPI00203DCEB9|nr:stress protein [Sporosarcina sp. NCCP-2716]